MANRTEEIFLIDCGNYIINAKKIRYAKLDSFGCVEVHLDRGEVISFEPIEKDGVPTFWEQLNAFNPFRNSMK
jgi:hypothetical protein